MLDYGVSIYLYIYYIYVCMYVYIYISPNHPHSPKLLGKTLPELINRDFEHCSTVKMNPKTTQGQTTGHCFATYVLD
jgi:hypothetical protein